jgi:site-specific recombinase XerD
MVTSNGPVFENVTLDPLVADALGRLEQLEYSRRSLYRYRVVWEHLIAFAQENQLGDAFSESLATRFVEVYRLGDGERDRPGEGWRRHIGFAVQVLGDLAQHGQIERPFPVVGKMELLPAMKNALRDYAQYGQERLHLYPSTLKSRTRELTIFLDFLGERKATTLDQVTAADLSAFVSSRHHLKPKTLSRILSDVRSFLRFLTLRGILPNDLSGELPKVCVPHDASIPSVWESELVAKLLEAIDRSAAKGKRDYAMLLLAARLGLRVGDIRTLTLDHLHWEDSTLEIRQSKTGTPLILPLTEEVGAALIDYLKTGRPKTSHREVFLKLNPPFEPFGGNNLYHIITYWRRVAGITFRCPRQPRGLHSLRHTLATRLLEEETPLPTIAAILGHTRLESTRLYAKADVDALRSVALDPEEVTHGN